MQSCKGPQCMLTRTEGPGKARSPVWANMAQNLQTWDPSWAQPFLKLLASPTRAKERCTCYSLGAGRSGCACWSQGAVDPRRAGNSWSSRGPWSPLLRAIHSRGARRPRRSCMTALRHGDGGPSLRSDILCEKCSCRYEQGKSPAPLAPCACTSSTVHVITMARDIMKAGA